MLIQRPTTLAITMIAAGLLADSAAPGFLRFRAFGSGALLAIAGLGLMLWAHETFRRCRTPVPHHARPDELVEVGPYRHSRNPMYLGIGMALFGAAFAMGGLAGLGAAATWLWLMNAVHVPFEEARMASTFGGRWRAYAHRVRRWL